MAYVGMEELIGDERCEWWERALCRDISPQGGGREAKRVDHAIEPGLRGCGLVEEDRQIRRNQAPRDDGLHRLGERIVVVDRRHHHRWFSAITGSVPAATARRRRPCRWHIVQRRTESRRDGSRISTAPQ